MRSRSSVNKVCCVLFVIQSLAFPKPENANFNLSANRKRVNSCKVDRRDVGRTVYIDSTRTVDKINFMIDTEMKAVVKKRQLRCATAGPRPTGTTWQGDKTQRAAQLWMGDSDRYAHQAWETTVRQTNKLQLELEQGQSLLQGSDGTYWCPTSWIRISIKLLSATWRSRCFFNSLNPSDMKDRAVWV